ncbi:hypothetical protein L1887_52842 [Cichorium endivia]|nr:hypothetical protein L1887_52842 [Cichorium endivia]
MRTSQGSEPCRGLPLYRESIDSGCAPKYIGVQGVRKFQAFWPVYREDAERGVACEVAAHSLHSTSGLLRCGSESESQGSAKACRVPSCSPPLLGGPNFPMLPS